MSIAQSNHANWGIPANGLWRIFCISRSVGERFTSKASNKLDGIGKAGTDPVLGATTILTNPIPSCGAGAFDGASACPARLRAFFSREKSCGTGCGFRWRLASADDGGAQPGVALHLLQVAAFLGLSLGLQDSGGGAFFFSRPTGAAGNHLQNLGQRA